MDLTKFNGFSIDIEADGLVFDAKTVWVINCEDLDTGEKLQVTPFKDSKAKDKLERFAAKYSNPNIAFHNGLGYDIFVLMFVMGIDYSVGPDTFFGKPVNFVDTFYLSMYLNPDREKHSLEHWGTIVGMPKIDFRQELIDIGFLDKSANQGQEFLQYHELMLQYCERDAKVCKLALIKMVSEWRDLYGSWDCNEWPKHFKAGQKSFYLMSCQELAGWKFDIESAYKLKETISKMMEDIKNEVEPKLPPRALKKTEGKEYSIPAKPFKKNGGLSSTMFKWLARHNAEIDQLTFEVVAYGSRYDIIPNLLLDIKKPMEMANQDQMKDWFLSNGWVPTLWNYKKDSDGKPIRDPKTRQPIKTSPKIQEQGKLCENLEKMEGSLVKKVVKWLSLRNRLSVLQGWLDNPRLQYDGRIGAGRTGIAATHRQKHKVVVNVPKADQKVLLGYEFRSLWTSEDGYLIAAGDAAAIEGRVQGHYCYKYDGGATADDLLKGDVHSKNCNAFYGNIYPEVSELYSSPDFNKDNPKWKPYRSKAKNGFYSILYGAAAPKVASTLGIPEKYGKDALEAFWSVNVGTKQLKDNLEKYWESKGKKKNLPAIDGRALFTRKKSALLNTIFQSCGGITMDYAGLFMDKWLGKTYWDDKRRPYYIYKGCIVRRIGYFHDELEYECQEQVATEVSKMIEMSIVKAGEYLKLKVPLAGEGKIGKTWKETH